MTSEGRRPRLGPLGWRLLAAFVLVAAVTTALLAAAAVVGTGRGIEQASGAHRARVAAEVAAAAAAAYRAAGSWGAADLSEVAAIAAAADAHVVIVAPDGSVVSAAGKAVPPSPDALPAESIHAALARVVAAAVSRAPSAGTATATAAPSRPGGTPGGGTAEPAPTPSGSRSSSAPGPSGDASGRPSPSPSTAPTGTATGPDASAAVVVDGLPVGVVALTFDSDQVTAARDVAWHWVAAAAGGAFLLAVLVGVVVTRRIAVPLLRVADAAETFADGDRDVRTGVSGPGEIGVVARSVDTMAEAVVRSEDSQRRLASDVAHELRTPLTALQLGLEEVRDGLVEPDAELLTGLHDQSLRLGRIVDDLGALSEAEATGFALRPTDVDLAALAGSETAAQEPRLRAAGLTVTVVAGGPVLVLGDADRLRQVLTNLLSNAARYCRPGDEVAVTVVERDGLARLSVRDTGPGIPADELPHVFERFWRGGSGARTQGSGLGLAVVRELVNAHRGQVHVESDGATGTTFRVDLPLAGRAG